MAKVLTKAQWEDLKKALLSIPTRKRNINWKDAINFIDDILVGRNNVTPDIDVSKGVFAVECVICRKPIAVDEDYVRHAITSTYQHYDCHHKTTASLGDLIP